MLRVALLLLLAFLVVLAGGLTVRFVVLLGDGESAPLEPVSAADSQRVQAELVGRSFRQFEPDRDADERKGVVLDFFDGITLWAQYAEDGHVVSEWEVRAAGYRVESRGDVGDEVTITFVEPASRQQFPDECEDCVDASGVSISVRNVFDADGIRFRIDDPDGVLTSPFPVFGSWTRFEEDEYLE